MTSKDIVKGIKLRPFNLKFTNPNNNWSIYNCYTSDERMMEYGKKTYAMDCDFGSEPVYEINILGIMPNLTMREEYVIDGLLEYNSKYNSYGVNVQGIRNPNKSNPESQRQFLENLTSQTLSDEILKVYPNFIDMVINDEKIDTSVVKGLGSYRLDKIKEKIIENYVVLDIVEIFHGTVSVHQIMNIIKGFISPISAKLEIEKNPYVITKVKGIGFKKADNICLKLRPELKESLFRANAFVSYYLDEMGDDEGHTWEYIDTLVAMARENVKESLNFVKDIVEGKEFVGRYKIYNGKIGLKRIYNVEKSIFENLNRINDAESDIKPVEESILTNVISETEKSQGFEFTKLQKETIMSINDITNNVILITGKAGCVDCDTEYFNGSEWVRIADYKVGDMVLQFEPLSKNAELVEPTKYHKYEESMLYHVKNYGGSVDQILSLEHNIAYVTSKGNIAKKQLSEVIEQHNGEGKCFNGKFLNAFNYSGSGIDMTDEMIRVMVAVFADGSYYYNISENANTYNKCRFHIKKERKKDRLKKLFTNANLDWEEKKSSAEGYSDFYIYTPFRAKSFPIEWYKATKHQLEIIFEELMEFDGHFGEGGRRSFSTTIKNDADFVQFVASSLGYTANITKYDRTGQEYNTCGKVYKRKSIEYQVTFSKNKFRLSGISGGKTTPKIDIVPYTNHDGYKYCFTVPSGYLVLRRNNKIFITSNSGKSSVVNGIINAIEKVYQANFQQAALSAKASRRMYEVTSRPAVTIHKLLGWDGSDFVHNEDVPLYSDIIIADEFSMNNIFISNSLFKAVKSGSKLILVFDTAQLSSIGAGSVAHDLINHSRFKKFMYTEVHRQAQKSGILVGANIVRTGKYPIGNPSPKIVTGELKDMTYFFRDDKEDIHELALNLYKTAVDKYGVDDVALITPRKDTVLNSTEKFNSDIQNMINPNSNKNIILNDGREFRFGDKVIQRVNNKDKNVINGEVGYIIDIGEKQFEGNGNKFDKFVTVDYGVDLYELSMSGNEIRKIVDYIPTEMKEVYLAYALTTHLYQGSQSKVVIGVLDSSHYTLLDNTMLYTLMTRAQERCALVTDTFAFKKAVTTNNTIQRQTFLEDILKYSCEDVEFVDL